MSNKTTPAATLPRYGRADLHCHSVYSDGVLTPSALAQHAAAQGVDLWALTDHDSVAGQQEARESAQALGLAWVSGVEVFRDEVSHKRQTILHPQPGEDERHRQRQHQHRRNSRIPRAQAMAAGLAAVGIADAYAGALQYAGQPEQLSRTHFARHLVAIGRCATLAEVFRPYLVPGKPGYAPHGWAALHDGIAQIVAAGGVAVLAHPGRYKLERLPMQILLDRFAQAGGQAIEVTTSAHTPAQTHSYAALARARGWAASCGSDFHSPAESRCALGSLPPLPSGLTPVWQLLGPRIVA